MNGSEHEDKLWAAAVADVKAFIAHTLAANGLRDQLEHLADVDEMGVIVRRTWDGMKARQRHSPRCQEGTHPCFCRPWALISGGVTSSIVEMGLDRQTTHALILVRCPAAVAAFMGWYNKRQENPHARS